MVLAVLSEALNNVIIGYNDSYVLIALTVVIVSASFSFVSATITLQSNCEMTTSATTKAVCEPTAGSILVSKETNGYLESSQTPYVPLAIKSYYKK